MNVRRQFLPVFPVLVAAVFLAALPACPRARGAAPRYEVIPLQLGLPLEKIIPADLDGDGLRDLLVVRERELAVFFQDPPGFRFSRPDARLELEYSEEARSSSAWDVADLSGSGRPQVVTLEKGRTVKVWPLEGRKFGEARILLEGLSAALPVGIYHLPFVRDLDGDGDGDFVIPGSNTYHLYLRGGDGSYSGGAIIQRDMSWTLELDGEGDLDNQIGQSLSLPLFTLRDVNGDSREDLVSRTEDRLEVYLAGAGGSTFPAAPTYSLDLAAERERMGEFDVDDLDFSNLTGALARGVQVVLADINGDRIEDLLLRAGGRFIFFLGRKEGMDMKRPHQVLRASGNVILGLLEDENEDGRPDLWILRVEKISLGDVFLWLITSGSIDFEIFIYRNEGSRFTRRPSRRIILTLTFPSIRSMLGGLEKPEREEGEEIPPHRPADLAGAGSPGDLLVLREGRLEAYLGRAGPPGEAPGISAGDDLGKRLLLEALGKLHYSREKDEYEVAAMELSGIFSSREDLPEGVKGAAPDLQIDLPGAGENPTLFLLDMNGDGRDDFLLLYREEEGALKGAVVISRK